MYTNSLFESITISFLDEQQDCYNFCWRPKESFPWHQSALPMDIGSPHINLTSYAKENCFPEGALRGSRDRSGGSGSRLRVAFSKNVKMNTRRLLILINTLVDDHLVLSTKGTHCALSFRLTEFHRRIHDCDGTLISLSSQRVDTPDFTERAGVIYLQSYCFARIELTNRVYLYAPGGFHPKSFHQ